jgi:uncharacterized membrane-anchored protein
MFVEYGIEQYFFERNARIDSRVNSVEVKVDRFGRARIIKLLSNGKPVNMTYSNKLA